ncbi:MAG: TRAM domain-containing protein [Candidatus Micrarchaeia archaeon]|jgi:23S rRNA (uracil1939-C5)-methyltransferase
MEIPVEKGKKYKIKITAITGNNEGIGHFENFPIYVKEAKQGEEIKVEIIDIKRYYAIGR